MPITFSNTNGGGNFTLVNNYGNGNLIFENSGSIPVPPPLTATPTTTPTNTPTSTPTATPTATPTNTPTSTITSTNTPTTTPTNTPTNSNTTTNTPTATPTSSPTSSPTATTGGDSIRAALQPAFTASYDAASVGSFINVNSASYNNVFASLTSTTKYGQSDAALVGAIGGGSAWGAPFAFAFTASVVPSGSYIVGYATVISSAGASQSLAIYYSTASNATASTAIGDRIAPANNFISSGSNSVYYFVRKAPPSNLPANSVMYLWSTGSLTIKGPNIARIPYKSVVGPAPLQITGSWLSWNTANTGQPGHQFIATSQLQW